MPVADLFPDLFESFTRTAHFPEKTIRAVEQLLIEKNGKAYFKCQIRGKEIMAKPEEITRQLWLQLLLTKYKYPASRIQVEYPITFGRDSSKRADIVIFDADRPTVPYIIIEVKQPTAKGGKEQLKSYTHATGAPLAVWSDGTQVIVWHRKNPNYFEEIPALPGAHETIEMIAGQPWTIDTLIEFEKQRDAEGAKARTLRDKIQDMEDEVLANAGVDVFEEVFKLIFTKLFDEMSCYAGESPHLRFRNVNSAMQMKAAIQSLYDEARAKWDGVFPDDDKIRLTPEHLQVCVGSLEQWKLFNSNLDVVDDAFEYLVSKSSKGEKGQYFTPRWVIDMCVKMLNPREDEPIIDTACGSAGFTMHSIFHVWGAIMADMKLPKSNLFTMEKKPPRCLKYVQEKVFAIDFDEKSVRVSRCLNLIAGDGQTNVLHLNTLDYKRWDETTKQPDWTDTYHAGWKNLRKLMAAKNDYRNFKFSVLMANPPFAGDIKQTDLLSPYDLAHKLTKDGHLGKLETAVGRDLLFIERNLDFLAPGGRMAVVLPRGRLNNPSQQHVRDFIGERARVLAVVSADSLTFKPHTDTKTCILFVQKWNDDPEEGPLCPRVHDYPIFFATQLVPSKDTGGNKLYVSRPDGERLRDTHGHWIVRHDLFNHDGLTQNGIAEAFASFAKREGFSFAVTGPTGPHDASHPSASVVNWSRTQESRRLDADYYQPKFQEVMANLRRKQLTIADVARLRKDQFVPEDTGDFRYIEIGGISWDGFASEELVLHAEAPSRAKWIVRTGDVLTSLVRPARCLTALLSKEHDGCVCSSGFAVLEPVSVSAEVLFAYLRQPDVCWMMDMHCTASLYPAISATDLLNLPFLPPSEANQLEIVRSIDAAWKMRMEATKLVRQASNLFESQ